MGTTNNGATRAGDTAADGYLERLAPLGTTSKKMFGGHGLFVDGTMFGMVTSTGALAFKANDGAEDRYQVAGAERQGKMPYWTVPDAVLADDDALLAWAADAAEQAVAAKK